MKLYQTPGGVWAGTEKDYKAALKAENLMPKDVTRSQVDVPTSKAALMEFLSFHNVNVINPEAQAHADMPRSEVTGGAQPPTPAPSVAPTTLPLEEAVCAAPLTAQLDLVVGIIDRASAVIRSTVPKNPRD